MENKNQSNDNSNSNKLFERIIKLESKLESHEILSQRIDSIWRWAKFLIAAAAFLGISGGFLYAKFENAKSEIRKADDRMTRICDTVDYLQDKTIPKLKNRLMKDLMVFNDSLKTAKEKDFDQMILSFLGKPVTKELDRWYEAETNGFVRLSLGGNKPFNARAWVSAEQRKDKAGNRLTLNGETSGLLIVREGEFYMASKGEDQSSVNLCWIPIAQVTNSENTDQ